MLRLFLLVLTLPACSAVVQPDPSRLGEGLDAAAGDAPLGPGEDGGPGQDVPAIDQDAPGDACAAVVCERGERCIEGACVCPPDACCPACELGSNCVEGSCEPCGRGGETCCDGVTCFDASEVCYADLCRPCGAPTQPCCASGTCDSGATCNGAVCVRSDCGNPGQPCCGDGSCAEGAVCTSSPFSGRTCQTCGIDGGPCCPGGTCGTDTLFCDRGTCRGCGGVAQPCCPGELCRGGVCDRFARICRPG
jgi:hypothetical protein